MVLVSRGRSGNGTGGVVAAHAPPIDPYNLLLSFSAFLALVQHKNEIPSQMKVEPHHTQKLYPTLESLSS